ncbi:MAG TPA: threonine synthase [Polyangia bacterium]|jgi:threonine synthase|nr:threonine synthase [Polyangia bacterium]
MSTALVGSNAQASFVQGLQCRECGNQIPKAPVHVCEFCFGPLEVTYDYAAIGKVLTRALIESRPKTMWRYAELLPLDGPPAVGLATGMTPLLRADRLAKKLGVRELWVKNDAVNYPTLSFKDRVVSVAVSKAREFGLDVVACASTGNLANATAAQAAAAGMPAVILIPFDLEPAKVLGTIVYGARVFAVKGTYDDVNRLCSEIAGKYGWGFVNVNLRPFYGEGSKSYGFEIAEQLGWKTPAHVVVPMAGGALVTKIGKAFAEFEKLGLLASGSRKAKIHGAQAAGCSPIVDMVLENREQIRPVKTPTSIAKSLAIGNPADGFYARQTIIDSGGWAAKPDDPEIIAAMRLLAETEGIFAETAGGVTLGATIRLINDGKIGRDDGPIVVCVTGNGMKTQDPLVGQLPEPVSIGPRLSDFDEAQSKLKS